MRKALVVSAVFVALGGAALAASAGVRYVVEDGATGAQTYYSAPHLVYGQDRTTLRAAVCDTGVCTRAAPSGCTGEGLRVGALQAIRVSIAAPQGGALLGTGNLRAYYYDPDEAERTGCDAGYYRNPDLDFAVTGTGATQLFPDLLPGASVNGTRLVYVADSVGVDGGDALADGGYALTVKTLGICLPGAC